MKKLFAIICGIGLVFSAVSCNSSSKEDTKDEGIDIELTGTAWSSGSGNLAINFPTNDGISVVNMKKVYLLGTYVRNKSKFTATFTTRIDNYDSLNQDDWKETDLSDNPTVINFTFTVRKDKDNVPVATVSGGSFPDQDNDVILVQTR